VAARSEEEIGVDEPRGTREIADVLSGTAMVGVAELAHELEALGRSDADDSLKDGRHLRPALFREVARLRGEGS
jgi:hypothetical protein